MILGTNCFKATLLGIDETFLGLGKNSKTKNITKNIFPAPFSQMKKIINKFDGKEKLREFLVGVEKNNPGISKTNISILLI